MVKALPEDSALVRSHTGGAPWGWDQELAAVQVEATQGLARILAAGFGAKRSRIPKPLHIKRPYEVKGTTRDPTQPRRKATVEEMMEIIGPMLEGPNG